MKSILILGAGRFGRHLALNFANKACDVLVVDRDEDRLQPLLPYVTEARIGNSTNEAFLRDLGVANFDLAIVAIGNDFQASLETTSLLKELGAPMVVSRASRDVQAKFLLRNGADDVIYPERDMADWASMRYSSANIFDYVALDDDHGIYEVAVPPAWVGQSIGALQVRNRYALNILALVHADGLDLNINHETILRAEDHLMVLGAHPQVHKVFQLDD